MHVTPEKKNTRCLAPHGYLIIKMCSMWIEKIKIKDSVLCGPRFPNGAFFIGLEKRKRSILIRFHYFCFEKK